MSKLSGIKDVDREILSKLHDKELLKTCSIDKYTWNTVCDDAFLRRRLTIKYPKIEQYKKKEESWKSFFLRAIHYIALMKEKFDYEYTFGNFVTQYNLLKKYLKMKNYEYLLVKSSKKGELNLVIWCLNKGADIHFNYEGALRLASRNGHLETVKYLVENGANIHAYNDVALRLASAKGQLETVKYLVDSGADIHVFNNTPLRYAIESGNSELENYLRSKY